MGRAFLSLLRRDITLAMRRRTDVLTTLFFFVIVVSLFPFGVGSEQQILRQLGPGVVWVAALLASMLALERLFAADYEDGTLEQLLLTRHPLSLLVLAKVTAHWLLTGLPVVLIAPLIGMQYYLPETAIVAMMLALLVGTPVLSLVGAIGAALTLGLRGGGILLSLLILPLYVPVLVYGAGAVTAAFTTPAESQPYFYLLGAFLVLSLILAPLASAAALRISLE
ncbi:heme exporter protein CcmB [Thiococcus pfennigii]|jgi:heme exporter protein B|uniref:heme exporter protein CcmB n=1 Tax=Thiococcus pfennigii TaxID=1057 RepID=UPI001902F6D9|nr:heme exporter protein CcmB [Thiococcus pfennigii]MBK1701792.1 heme exporter protein CcmB [Thiococcus pfennigii]MBK1731165.1 heme exporter protein CcmB [Thiococcus pfennigii]